MTIVTVVKGLENAQIERMQAEAVGAGVFYLLKAHKDGLYEGAHDLPHLAGVSQLVQYCYNGFAPQGALMPCKGVVKLGGNFVEVAHGLKNHFELVRQVLPRMRSWLAKSLTLETQEALELEAYYANPEHAFLQKASLVRADLIVDAHGNWRSCDPNAMPLGMAFVQVYSGLLKSVGVDVEFPNYLQQLAKSGRVVIVTSLDYPNWSSHAYVAQKVTEMGGNMLMVTPDLIGTAGVDGQALRKLYKALGFDYEHIPDEIYRPDLVIRYVREETEVPGVLEVNAPGTRLLEAQILTTLAWLKGIEKFIEPSVNLAQVRKSVVPGMMLRILDGEVQVATEAVVCNGEFEVNWEPLEEHLQLLQELLSEVGLVPNRNLKWVVKATFSSGFKGVRMSGKGSLNKAARLIAQTADGFIPEGEVFFVQPRIPSEVEIEGEPLRAKLDLYMMGSELHPVAADLMTTPKSHIAVHGGSGTDYWLVQY